MNTLKIVTLSTREPVELGSVRYYLPPRYEPSADQGDVIIVAPVSADSIGAPGDNVGSVHVITSQGSRVVDTVGLGVLVVPAE